MDLQTQLIQSVQFLRLTIPRMKNLKIPITPENYSVWYEYSSGRTLELNKAIDDLLNNGQEFTSEINRNLYDTYISSRIPQNLLGGIQSETENLLLRLLSELEIMRNGTNHFSDVLKASTKGLEDFGNNKLLAELVANLVAELDEVVKSNNAMEDALKSMTDEVIGLRLEMEKLHGVALTDSLTGVMNRRAFDESIADQFNNPNSKSLPFSLLMADIDHFKQFNDNYGHSAGDRVLVYVSNILKKCIKGNDIVARYGGEEFAIILPDTNYDNAMVVANHICEKIRQKVLTSGDINKKNLGRITISIGVSQYKQNDTQSLLLERADKALYMAKNQGRDQAVGELSFSD